MIIREYKTSDSPSLVPMLNDFQDYIVAMDPLQLLCRKEGFGEHYLSNLIAKLEKHNGVLFVAEEEGELIGFVAGLIKSHPERELLEVYQSTFGEVIELYVKGSIRSKGIGAQLLSRIENYFQKKECDNIFIEVFAPNDRARSFYEKHGYHIRDYFMAKRISNITPIE